MTQHKRLRRTMSTVLSAIIAASATLPGLCQSKATPKQPVRRQAPLSWEDRIPYQDDVLLLMPHAKSTQEDIDETLKEVNGTIISSFGSGSLKTLVIRTEHHRLAETESKLAKTKRFDVIQRNRVYSSCMVPTDGEFAEQWHLDAIHAPKAWDYTRGPVWVAVFDSGCEARIRELSPKVDFGFNAKDKADYDAANHSLLGMQDVPDITNPFVNRGAAHDILGHGTLIATTIAALGNNGDRFSYDGEGLGVAPAAAVYPVQIVRWTNLNFTSNSGTTTANDIAAGVLQLMTLIAQQAKGAPYTTVPPTKAPKIINLSYGMIQNFDTDLVLQKYFQAFHDNYGGLIFMSAANDGTLLSTKPYSYINVVSAVDRNSRLASFSNYGPCVTLTAPGVGIYCTDSGNNFTSASGTSLSTPIAAGVAALVWSLNPRLTNNQVDYILRKSATQLASSLGRSVAGLGTASAAGVSKSGNAYAGEHLDPRYTYGYGMVDAAAAVALTMATK